MDKTPEVALQGGKKLRPDAEIDRRRKPGNPGAVALEQGRKNADTAWMWLKSESKSAVDSTRRAHLL
jgi:hypothetical protein